MRRAFRRTLYLAGAAVAVVAGALWVLRSGAVPVVQVAAATVAGGASGGGGVVANGYVVARTQASVSAKLP